MWTVLWLFFFLVRMGVLRLCARACAHARACAGVGRCVTVPVLVPVPISVLVPVLMAIAVGEAVTMPRSGGLNRAHASVHPQVCRPLPPQVVVRLVQMLY